MAKKKKTRLREKIENMTPEELKAALRATAEDDRTVRADCLKLTGTDRWDNLEAGIAPENLEALQKAQEELEKKDEVQKEE